MVALAPSSRDTVMVDGTARLYRFPAGTPGGPPVLLVPSLINRWYVLDLRAGSSMVEGLTAAGLDVFCLDWGEPNDEDRYLEWDDVVARLSRTIRRVRREVGGAPIGVLGYCIGGTLSTIHTALEPESVSALVNLAGPIDFSEAGFLGHMTNPRWFDPEAIAGAGNMSAQQMQAGFVALRPTAPISKWVGFLDRLGDAERLEALQSLETWASDNIAFPAAAYVRYIKELYQDNRLIKGEHAVRGKKVDLSRITCPVMTVTTSRDVICPPPSALALNQRASSEDKRHVAIPGGHVGAVVGEKARTILFPALAKFFAETRSTVEA